MSQTDYELKREEAFKEWFGKHDLNGSWASARSAIKAFLRDVEDGAKEPSGNRPMTPYEISMHSMRMKML